MLFSAVPPSALLAFSLTVLPLAAAQGSWSRRVYYTDTACAQNVQYQEHVFAPTTPCVSTNLPAINAVCEAKSTDARVPSSEGTGCDIVATDSAVSDAAYFPPAGQGSVIPGANYLTINAYNAATCGTGAGTTSITQLTFAADGNCHVMEPGNYFKAACNSGGGVVQWCDDDQCTSCPTAKVLQVTSTCTGTGYQGQPASSICTLAAGNADLPLPALNGTTTIPVAPAAAASTAAAVSSAVRASATGAAAASSAAGSTATNSPSAKSGASSSAGGSLIAVLAGVAAAVAL
ncbi:hypothetical protein HKX48_000092 [Thoreauomyces humboldtii]|nr:hypothetical protein HKX48_000092 [Thoreauomyces humboldtii]